MSASSMLLRNTERVIRSLLRRFKYRFEYVFTPMVYVPKGWHSVSVSGWGDHSVAAAQEKHWPTLLCNLEGQGPLGVSHLPWESTRESRAEHNVLMSYGYVLGLAARKKDTLAILDWGSGVGHFYLYSKALLPDVEFQYHAYDVADMCRVGRRLLPEIHFSNDENDFLNRRYNLVISGSSLHYFEDWRREALKLAAATQELLYISRLQVVLRAPSFVVTHKINEWGYGEFQSWCINRQEFLSCIEACGLELVREFVYYNKITIRKAPESGDCRGYLFRRRAAAGSGIEQCSEAAR